MPAIPRFALTLAALLLVALAPSASAAATCAERPVAARGDASRFVVLAKANARGNWRAKVRSMPTLGAEYANFNKALAADYRCSEKAGQHTCEAFGHPCKD
jgi:hypothetical protein